MKYSIGRIRIAFFAAIAVLLSVPVLLYFGIQNLIESYYWVNHTWEVEYKVQRYYAGMRFSESAVRGYLLTSDTSYLREKIRYQQTLPQWTNELKTLVRDNPEQTRNMRSLERMILQRLSILDSTILLYQQGISKEELQRRLANGRLIMEAAERLAAEMFDIEAKLLRKREMDKNRYVRVVPIYLVLLTIVLLLVLSLIFNYLERQLRRQQSMQQQLQVTNGNLEEQKKALETSNEELESFNYVASHDLKEPLRKIRTFASMIQRQDLDQLSERGQHNFHRLVASAERMQLLLDDLLAYTRLKSPAQSREAVDLNKVMVQVQENLEELITDTGTTITIKNLPVVQGVPFQLQQLMDNLLHNAIKYRRKEVNPEIVISGTMAGRLELPAHFTATANSYHHITVQDNGIGFPQQYAGQVFDLFTRLHNDSSFSGTGIGLTICKKIVDNHDGFITVNSKVGEGTRFDIYLPA